jgi:hypothetical protein
MKHRLIKHLEEIVKMLKANAKADWTENDPAEEFKAMAKIVKGFIPTHEDHLIENLSHYICDDDVKAALDRLHKQSEIDGSVDAWDYVVIWEPFENHGLTVDDMLRIADVGYL